MLERLVLRGACWVNRRFQDFRGRWRLVDWLKTKEEAISNLPACKISVAPGYRMYVDPGDFDGRRYFIHGINPREPLSKLFFKILEPGDCVIDIGANVGYFTVLASNLVGTIGTVYSFEASLRTFRRLEFVRNNPNRNVKLHWSAVADQCGEIDFYEASPCHTGRSSIRHTKNVYEKTKVRSVNIDSFLGQLPKVKLVKIDVEGAEMLVLKGMFKLLERDKPFIVMELTDKFLRDLGSSADEVCDYMKEVQYSLHEIRAEFREVLSAPDYQCDVLCVYRGQASFFFKYLTCSDR